MTINNHQPTNQPRDNRQPIITNQRPSANNQPSNQFTTNLWKFQAVSWACREGASGRAGGRLRGGITTKQLRWEAMPLTKEEMKEEVLRLEGAERRHKNTMAIHYMLWYVFHPMPRYTSRNSSALGNGSRFQSAAQYSALVVHPGTSGGVEPTQTMRTW